jgi:hypothetical protein
VTINEPFPTRPWTAADWRWTDDEPQLQPEPGETFGEALTRMSAPRARIEPLSPAAREMIRQHQETEMTPAEARECLGLPDDNQATGLWPAIRDFHPFAESQEAARQVLQQYEDLMRYTYRGSGAFSDGEPETAGPGATSRYAGYTYDCGDVPGYRPDGEPSGDAMTRSGEDTGSVW